MFLLFIAAAVAPAIASETPIIKGFSYGPVPVKSQGANSLEQDDWMAEAAYAMWGEGGRGDLRILKELGANTVRTYGNNPENNHRAFFDEAQRNGLKVFPGLSDWPFTQMQNSCMTTNYNCFEQVRDSYLGNLKNGWLLENNDYHPAVNIVNMVNEPDLKIPPLSLRVEGEMEKLGRTLLSTFDGILEAEVLANVSSKKANLTFTFSYGVCVICKTGRVPGLEQMRMLQDALANPAKYGYTPRHNLTEVFNSRFTNSINSFVPAATLMQEFIQPYQKVFPSTPFYVGEYHHVYTDPDVDLPEILKYIENSPGNIFRGVSFFQFQVAYHKGGSETEYGVMGLGDHIIRKMNYFNVEVNVHCLEEVIHPDFGSKVASVARAFGGTHLHINKTCDEHEPHHVPLTEEEHAVLFAAAKTDATPLKVFYSRLLRRMSVKITPAATDFLNQYTADALQEAKPTNYTDVISYFHKIQSNGNPALQMDQGARCVADRRVDPKVIGEAIGYICTQSSEICESVPKKCQGTYLIADYVMSRYYAIHPTPKPLVDCNFEGAGIAATPDVYNTWEATLCTHDAVILTGVTTTTMRVTTTSTTTATTTTTALETTTTTAETSTSSLQTTTTEEDTTKETSTTTEESTTKAVENNAVQYGVHFFVSCIAVAAIAIF